MLTVVLKRFTSDKNKLDNTIDIDLEIDICKVPYFLFAVVIHSGSYNAGHYKLLVNEEMTMNWFLYDDSRVSRVSWSIPYLFLIAIQVDHQTTLNEFGGGSECSCICFYILKGRAYSILASERLSRQRKLDVTILLSSDESSSEPVAKSMSISN